MDVEVAPGIDFVDPSSGPALVVGAIVADAVGRVFVQRRSATRSLFPNCWDIIGGHVESGEDVVAALARELHEETGWELRRIDAFVAAFDWDTPEGDQRHEVDYLVTVDGDLSSPRLEWDKHPEYRWISEDEIDILDAERGEGDTAVLEVVTAAFALLHERERDGGPPGRETRTRRRS